MKVLAIDDQPEALKQINKAIAGANGPDGRPYKVTALIDHQEALSLAGIAPYSWLVLLYSRIGGCPSFALLLSSFRFHVLTHSFHDTMGSLDLPLTQPIDP